jgi:hypothetical protein
MYPYLADPYEAGDEMALRLKWISDAQVCPPTFSLPLLTLQRIDRPLCLPARVSALVTGLSRRWRGRGPTQGWTRLATVRREALPAK